ncbi:hypothetical protein D9X91_00405 [Falsibacillus albus]|uniref:Uncharacterized protein n=1 Tax=Falsibacillus albus TaxID=2478915 RepID=A0A3L7K6W6_9BACI|nr:hypothetical protein D9X91_00405 [Falsibacillus albus]
MPEPRSTRRKRDREGGCRARNEVREMKKGMRGKLSCPKLSLCTKIVKIQLKSYAIQKLCID